MHSTGLASLLLLLPALCLAAPVKQHPLGSHNGPFSPKHKDPYDRKVDSVGHDLHPEPYVSQTSAARPSKALYTAAVHANNLSLYHISFLSFLSAA